MIDKKKEAECLSDGKPCCFPECNHVCGYNPETDDKEDTRHDFDSILVSDDGKVRCKKCGFEAHYTDAYHGHCIDRDLCKKCKNFDGEKCDLGHQCINGGEFVDAGYSEEATDFPR